MQLMRLFVGEPVWTAYNRPQEEHPARKEYIESFTKKVGVALEAHWRASYTVLGIMMEALHMHLCSSLGSFDNIGCNKWKSHDPLLVVSYVVLLFRFSIFYFIFSTKRFLAKVGIWPQLCQLPSSLNKKNKFVKHRASPVTMGFTL